MYKLLVGVQGGCKCKECPLLQIRPFLMLGTPKPKQVEEDGQGKRLVLEGLGW